MKTIIGILALMATMAGMAMAEGDDNGCWIVESAVPEYHMTATEHSITIENWGTAPGDVGGLRLITKRGNVGTDVASLPYTKILRPEPFPTKGAQNNNYKITVATNQNLTKGDMVYLTNGVGIYATAIVA